MPLTENDQTTILNAYNVRVSQVRGDYLEYFCDLALEFYVDLVEKRKDELVREMTRIAGTYPHPKIVRIPIHTFETYNSTSKHYQMTLEEALGKPGAYFKSPTGMNRANMHTIYTYSDFKEKLESKIAPNLRDFYVTMTSTIIENSSMLTVYSNTLWLNLKI